MANWFRRAGMAAGVAVVMGASLGAAQTPGAPGVWTGHVSCQVDVQSDGYEQHETQTWTLTGGSPTSQGIPTYPAIWSVTGHGTARQVLGAPPGAVSWKSTVGAANTSVALFVRPSDSRLVILPRTRLSVPGGHSGTRQLASGAKQNVQYPAYEWSLPVIADSSTSTHMTGSGTTVVTGAMLPAHGVSGSAAASCSWDFSRSGDASTASPETLRAPAAPATPRQATQSGDAALVQVSPNSAVRGQQKITVTISGRSTHFDQKTTKVMVGAGLFVSVESVTVSSPTRLVANLNIVPTRITPPSGTNAFLVSVTTGSEVVQLFGGFHVSAPHRRSPTSK